MCGRYVLGRSESDLESIFDIDLVEPDVPAPSYNIAPSMRVPIVVARRLVGARWGLVPRFATSLTSGPTPFNARAEKLTSSPMYRGPFRQRRAIIPADGFYERRKADQQSFYIHPIDDGVMAFAGLYEWWRPRDSDDPWLLSAAIITRGAQGPMAGIHDRQPLRLAPELWTEWLDPETPGDQDLLAAALDATAESWEYRKVGPGWLSTRPGQHRDDAELLKPLD